MGVWPGEMIVLFSTSVLVRVAPFCASICRPEARLVGSSGVRRVVERVERNHRIVGDAARERQVALG